MCEEKIDVASENCPLFDIMLVAWMHFCVNRRPKHIDEQLYLFGGFFRFRMKKKSILLLTCAVSHLFANNLMRLVNIKGSELEFTRQETGGDQIVAYRVHVP